MSVLLIIIVVIVLIFGITAFTGAPFVPSKKREIEDAFKKLYPLSKKDFLIDLGSGNGKVLEIASKFGSRSLGLEINPFLIIYSKIRLRGNKLANVKSADFFHFKFPDETTVIYVFGVERDSARIIRAVQRQANRLHKTLYVVSYAMRVKNMKPIKSHDAYYLFEIKEEQWKLNGWGTRVSKLMTS